MRQGASERIVRAFAVGSAWLLLGGQPSDASVKPLEQLENDIDKLAGKISQLLENPAVHTFVADQIESSKLKALPMRTLLAGAISQNLDEAAAQLNDLVGQVHEIETQLIASDAEIPRLDIKLPVKGHQESLRSSKKIYVLAAPFGDESEVNSIKAYSKGQPITLDANEPPKIPALVILPAESEGLDPPYPLQFSDQPGHEENPRRVDDFVGIPKIWLEDDREGWTSGDPEIYVKINRIQRTGGPTGIESLMERFDLPGVNDEQVWYDLGDQNVTYRYLDTSGFTGYVTFYLYEDDNFAHGSDDFLGSEILLYTSLPLSDYTTFIIDYAQLKVDRD
jgi:hypothetical protein